MDGFDCVVAGAGVLGLAVARRVSQGGLKVLVVERAATIGTGTSSRNSEVIHAGLYYEPGSAKASLCVEGRELLYRYCGANAVPHSRLGKLVVAVEPDQLGALDRLCENAAANGVGDISLLSSARVHQLEPQLRCFGALLSPSTGIIDSAKFMGSLQHDAEQAGTMFAFHTSVIGGAVDRQGLTLMTQGTNGERFEIKSETFVNAAGLDSGTVASGISGFPQGGVPQLFLARGCYFQLRGRSPFSRLIYPLPVDGGLGIHLTLDLAGAARFGPDVEWIDTPDYTVDPGRAVNFEKEIRRYWPGLPENTLLPGYSGIRPKLSGRGMPNSDFLIQAPNAHGAGPMVNLFGMESPGLTSSLAIAERVYLLLFG